MECSESQASEALISRPGPFRCFHGFLGQETSRKLSEMTCMPSIALKYIHVNFKYPSRSVPLVSLLTLPSLVARNTDNIDHRGLYSSRKPEQSL